MGHLRLVNPIAFQEIGLLAASSGYLYSSTDAGGTWRPLVSLPSTNWSPVASSADGSRLVAAVNGGNLYSSTNSGITWFTNNAPTTTPSLSNGRYIRSCCPTLLAKVFIGLKNNNIGSQA